MATFCSAGYRDISLVYGGSEDRQTKTLVSSKRRSKEMTGETSAATTSYQTSSSSASRGVKLRSLLCMARSSVLRLQSSSSGETKKKIAKLYVKKQQTVPLPTFSDPAGNPQHLSVFLRGPEGRQCMLNTKALQKYEMIDENGVFRCYLPKIEFLSFEVAPVLDLLVASNEESCRVDLLSCKFDGSDNLLRSQNERFSASMTNRLSWSTQHYLDVQLELNVALEVYTLPFTMLPISAVESPGVLILQLLVDRLVPLFLEQLFTDYRAWAETRVSTDGDEITS